MASIARGGSAAVAMALALAGCPDGFDTDSAYERERYLCEPGSEAAWNDAVAQCRAEFLDDGSCHGVLSMRGALEGTPLVFTSTLRLAELANVTRLDASVDRSDISMQGASPYFTFDFTMESLGGDVPTVALPRLLTIGATPDRALRYDDAIIEAAMRIEAGLDSSDQNLADGTVTITVQELGESAGYFAVGGRNEGDVLEGCFHAFDASPELKVEQP